MPLVVIEVFEIMYAIIRVLVELTAWCVCVYAHYPAAASLCMLQPEVGLNPLGNSELKGYFI